MPIEPPRKVSETPSIRREEDARNQQRKKKPPVKKKEEEHQESIRPGKVDIKI